MARLARFHTHRRERGITLVLVVIVMFSMVAIAALAIDVASLYVAKAEAQRIADASALAGAATLVDHGITADPNDINGTWTATCFQAGGQATRIGGRGTVGGVAATVTPCFPNGGACSSTCPAPTGIIGTGFGANPQMSVTVRSAPLPLFFARIWGSRSATVSATAQAEGFNPSGTDIPVAAKCVTPWLLPNVDPNGPAQIFDPGTGATLNSEPTTPTDLEGPVGRAIQLTTGCPGGCGTPGVPAIGAGTPQQLSYYPLDLANPASSGPSCSVAGTYRQNITACNATPVTCGQTVTLEATATVAGNLVNNQKAIECRIGANAGNTPDTLDVTSFPYKIRAGDTHNGVAAGTPISTSRSVVTIPVYDSGPASGPLAPTNTVTVIGFVQAFVSSASGGDPTITILNVSGCGTTARTSTVPPVGMNEGSPVPVRLIHQ